ncbi:uncharacterized protein LOC133310304 [Gastrolobium bilobum]|uniref:uncharacterized protein LOC133310304 n=1 Tax=Gastrolobium bilobum TaxID=150636 RepID=UPI002AB2D704|nr:uncharacterized protein LOC133310304 [Gastrolobium bilobum]
MRRLRGNRGAPNAIPVQLDLVAAWESEVSHHTGDASQHTIIVKHFEEANVEERRLISFRKHKPPSFLGSKDPKVVTTWLQGMEKIFQVMRCQDPQRLRYSVYMLEGEAHEWWCNASRPFEIQGQEMTWGLFQNLFHEEYFPRYAREAKQGEFDRVVQGTMLVDAYVAKFNELVKFANYGGVLPTPNLLAAKFQKGLNEKIAKCMSNIAVRNFADLVTQCKRVETVYGRYPKSSASREQEMKKNANPFDSNWMGNNKGKGLQVRQPSGKFKRGGALGGRPNDRYFTPQCGKCKKYHRCQCGVTPNACFKYGQTGHFARNCTSTVGQAANLQALPTSATITDALPMVGRVYTTNVQHFDKAPNLVKGIIFISNHDLSVLFDSGVTHSFIGNIWLWGNLNVTRMDSPMHITTATRESGCEKEEEILNIPLVSEFVDVFPDEIPKFSSEREIELSIDMLPSVGPISFALYRMSPLELAELKKHIEELFAKKFIRPSVSP